MSIKTQCIRDLDASIQVLQTMKLSIRRDKYKQAINEIADVLFLIGRALTCINQLEFISGIKKENRPLSKRKPVNGAKDSSKAQCLEFVDIAIANLRQARRYLLQNRYELAENMIAATLTGRILRCINSLTAQPAKRAS